MFHTAIHMTEVIRHLVAEGWQVTAEDLAQLSPYLTSDILRFGAYGSARARCWRQRGWTIPARDAGGASAMLWAWSTCPECRDGRWTG